VRVELRLAAEQLVATGPAAVDAQRLGVVVLTGEGALGAGLAEHFVLLRGELLTPLLVGLLDLVRPVCVVLLLLEHAFQDTARRRVSPGAGG